MSDETDESILEIPLLAIRNTVIFPVLAFPINVGREKSLAAVDAANLNDRVMGIITQIDGKVEDPATTEIYEVGSAVKIIKQVRMPGNKLNVIIQGLNRFRILEYTQTDPYLKAKVQMLDEESFSEEDLSEAISDLRDRAHRIIELSPHIPSEAAFLVKSIDNPAILSDIVASNLSAAIEEKQDLLETLNIKERTEKVLELLNKEIQVLELSNEINAEVRGEMDKAQREYFLREQMKAIQKELGEVDERQEEVDTIKRKIVEAKMPPEAEKTALQELKRMSRMNPSAAEYTVSRTYLDWLVDLPWSISSDDIIDIDKAEQILDEDHYGLRKVKERILEYLAVRQLKDNMKGPILCLVGPPGVGKTSLGKSIAASMGRQYIRMSLGGVRDEAEIRGHRRTYIGSLPGRIIKSLKKAGTNNPVIVLDEVDKLGQDYRGDPSSALLEVLDPEQNSTFNDHYLELDFDLSKVLFLATANDAASIPGPLRDRMEIIEVPGYIVEEKLLIARNHLIPEIIFDHGLTSDHIEFIDEGILCLITAYTREAGVRQLKREIAAMCRSVAKRVARNDLKETVLITPEVIREKRGAQKHFDELASTKARAGVVTGLAWTAVGGTILFIEVVQMPGKGKMTLTGKMGDTMKESATAAKSWIRAHASELGINKDIFENTDLHIHIPQGAVPKDGPSAGITMVTAMVSALTGKTVDPLVAMSGEITLRGEILPVGGIKEKVLAARRSGIKTILLPTRCEKDVNEIDNDIELNIDFHFVNEMQEVLKLTLGDNAFTPCQ